MYLSTGHVIKLSIPVSEKCQDDIIVDLFILICPSSCGLILAIRGVGIENARESEKELKETQLFNSFLRKSAVVSLKDKAGKMYILYHR